MFGSLTRSGLLLGAVALLVLPAQLRADSIDVTVGSPTITGSGPYTWDYNETVSSSESVVSGDYFAIIDFNGFLGLVSAPTGWTLTTPTTLTGLSHATSSGGMSTISAPPLTSSATDSSSVINLVFTYSGSTIVGGASGTSLGDFKVSDTFNSTTPGAQLALSHDHTGTIFETNPFTTVVPTGAVPLPATASTGLALLAGLGGLVGLRRMISRRASA